MIYPIVELISHPGIKIIVFLHIKFFFVKKTARLLFICSLQSKVLLKKCVDHFLLLQIITKVKLRNREISRQNILTIIF